MYGRLEYENLFVHGEAQYYLCVEVRERRFHFWVHTDNDFPTEVRYLGECISEVFDCQKGDLVELDDLPFDVRVFIDRLKASADSTAER